MSFSCLCVLSVGLWYRTAATCCVICWTVVWWWISLCCCVCTAISVLLDSVLSLPLRSPMLFCVGLFPYGCWLRALVVLGIRLALTHCCWCSCSVKGSSSLLLGVVLSGLLSAALCCWVWWYWILCIWLLDLVLLSVSISSILLLCTGYLLLVIQWNVLLLSYCLPLLASCLLSAAHSYLLLLILWFMATACCSWFMAKYGLMGYCLKKMLYCWCASCCSAGFLVLLLLMSYLLIVELLSVEQLLHMIILLIWKLLPSAHYWLLNMYAATAGLEHNLPACSIGCWYCLLLDVRAGFIWCCHCYLIGFVGCEKLPRCWCWQIVFWCSDVLIHQL